MLRLFKKQEESKKVILIDVYYENSKINKYYFNGFLAQEWYSILPFEIAYTIRDYLLAVYDFKLSNISKEYQTIVSAVSSRVSRDVLINGITFRINVYF